MSEYRYIELVHFVRSYLYNRVYSDDVKYKLIGDELSKLESVQFARFMYNPPSYKVEVVDEKLSIEDAEALIQDKFNDILLKILKEDMNGLKEECQRILERNLGYKNDISIDDFIYEIFSNLHLLYSSVVIEGDSPELKIVWLTV